MARLQAMRARLADGLSAWWTIAYGYEHGFAPGLSQSEDNPIVQRPRARRIMHKYHGMHQQVRTRPRRQNLKSLCCRWQVRPQTRGTAKPRPSPVACNRGFALPQIASAS